MILLPDHPPTQRVSVFQRKQTNRSNQAQANHNKKMNKVVDSGRRILQRVSECMCSPVAEQQRLGNAVGAVCRGPVIRCIGW